MNNKKILITGGAGFIGSHLTEKLNENNDLLVIDNLAEGEKENLPEKIRFKKLDVREKDKLIQIVKDFDPDYIFHLAAYNDAMGSIDEVEKTVKSNILGTVNLLEACLEINLEKIIYVSSGGLSYGEPEKVPTDESTKLNPIYPYGVSKSCGTMLIEDYGKRRDIDYVITRLGSVYGPRANSGVIKNFFKDINNDKRPVIYGDGSQTRDFIHVKDVTRGLICAAKRGKGCYNLGTETETSINKLLVYIENICDKEISPKFKERWEGDIDRCKLSLTKSKKELNWEPKLNLKEGLSRTKNYYIEGE